MILSEKDFLDNIEVWSVFYFKIAEVSIKIPHYFVVINKDILTSPVLVLPVATSQIEKRKKYYELQSNFLDKWSLIFVKPQETNNILEKESVFDCNQVRIKTIQELYEKYIDKELDYVWVLPESLVLKLREWVKLAKEIDNWIKDLV
jgi:hypothetical protein